MYVTRTDTSKQLYRPKLGEEPKIKTKKKIMNRRKNIINGIQMHFEFISLTLGQAKKPDIQEL